jgi:hypothetical protein
MHQVGGKPFKISSAGETCEELRGKPKGIKTQDLYTLYFKHAFESDRENTRLLVVMHIAEGGWSGDVEVLNDDPEWNAMVRRLPVSKNLYAIVQGCCVGRIVANYSDRVVIHPIVGVDRFLRFACTGEWNNNQEKGG